MTARLASLASKMSLTIEAIALPTVIEVAARKVGMTREAMVAAAEDNGALRDYLAKICRENYEAAL